VDPDVVGAANDEHPDAGKRLFGKLAGDTGAEDGVVNGDPEPAPLSHRGVTVGVAM
jgi:hypothetical protein